MPDEKTVSISEAKGRPMLRWVGKRPLEHVTAYPAQLAETFNPTGGHHPAHGLLLHGDNRDILAWLLTNGYRSRVNLVYIDPPFDSGANYVRAVELRGSHTRKLETEPYSLGEQIQYTDIWTNDTYLQFMYERLLMLRELMADDGFIFLQCDHRKNHHLRCLMDEVFGSDNFRNEIASRRGTTSIQSQFAEIDSLIPGYYTTLFYSKSREAKLGALRFKRIAVQPGKWDTLWRSHDRPTMRYELLGVTVQEGQWRWSEARSRRAVANYRHFLEGYSNKFDLDTYISEHHEHTGEILDMIKRSDDGTVQCYIPPQTDRLANNVWMDFPHMGAHTDYPTEKSERMLERVIKWTTRDDGLVLDCFVGSGTTAAVAQKLGRRWIAADINKGAIQTTSKRLQRIIQDQIAAGVTPRQLTLTAEASSGSEVSDPPPAALSFSVYRVNDYDLQIQHNEAVQLTVEHIGIDRTKTDTFFDGTLGKELVKIIPFNHPLTLLDLQLLKDELGARAQEERDVVVVCLGKELTVDTWIEEHNRHRPINKIRVIELRTDQKYGNFLVHRPAQAQVDIQRQGDQIIVEIQEFISPTIVDRLEMDTPLFKATIPDWRAMVDVVLIDTAYDGEVFNITLSDVPERKNDLVAGRYELPAPASPTTVAVKIIDMLGEEVLITVDV